MTPEASRRRTLGRLALASLVLSVVATVFGLVPSDLNVKRGLPNGFMLGTYIVTGPLLVLSALLAFWAARRSADRGRLVLNGARVLALAALLYLAVGLGAAAESVEAREGQISSPEGYALAPAAGNRLPLALQFAAGFLGLAVADILLRTPRSHIKNAADPRGAPPRAAADTKEAHRP
jgi:hypothetical protein